MIADPLRKNSAGRNLPTQFCEARAPHPLLSVSIMITIHDRVLAMHREVQERLRNPCYEFVQRTHWLENLTSLVIQCRAADLRSLAETLEHDLKEVVTRGATPARDRSTN